MIITYMTVLDKLKQENSSSDDGTKQLTLKIYKSYYSKNDDYYLQLKNDNDVDIILYEGTYKTIEAIKAAQKFPLDDIPQTSEKAYKAKWASFDSGKEFTIVYERNEEIVGFENLNIVISEGTDDLYNNIDSCYLYYKENNTYYYDRKNSYSETDEFNYNIDKSYYNEDDEYYFYINYNEKYIDYDKDKWSYDTIYISSDIEQYIYKGTYKTADELKSAEKLELEEVEANYDLRKGYKIKASELENGKEFTIAYVKGNSEDGNIIKIENRTISINIADDLSALYTLYNLEGKKLSDGKIEDFSEGSEESSVAVKNLSFNLGESVYDKDAFYYLSASRSYGVNNDVSISVYNGTYKTDKELEAVQELEKTHISADSSIEVYKSDWVNSENGKELTIVYKINDSILKIENITLTVSSYEDINSHYYLYDNSGKNISYGSIETSKNESDDAIDFSDRVNKLNFSVGSSICDKDTDYYFYVSGGNENIGINVYEGTYKNPEEITDTKKLDKVSLPGSENADYYKDKWASFDDGKELTVVYTKKDKDDILKIENFTLKVNINNDLKTDSCFLYDEESVSISRTNGSGYFYSDDEGVKTAKFSIKPSEYNKNNNYYLSLNRSQISNDITISVYDGSYKTVAELKPENKLESKKIFSEDAYKAKWLGFPNGKKFTVVYERNGNVVGLENLSLIVNAQTGKITGNEYLKYSYGEKTEEKITNDGITEIIYDLADKDYSMEDSYNLIMNYEKAKNDNYYYDRYYDDKDRYDISIDKVVKGFYDSAEAAANSPNIRDELFDSEKGYNSSYNGEGTEFTIIYCDNRIDKFRVKVTNTKEEEYYKELIEKYFPHHIIFVVDKYNFFFF